MPARIRCSYGPFGFGERHRHVAVREAAEVRHLDRDPLLRRELGEHRRTARSRVSATPTRRWVGSTVGRDRLARRRRGAPALRILGPQVVRRPGCESWRAGRTQSAAGRVEAFRAAPTAGRRRPAPRLRRAPRCRGRAWPGRARPAHARGRPPAVRSRRPRRSRRDQSRSGDSRGTWRCTSGCRTASRRRCGVVGGGTDASPLVEGPADASFPTSLAAPADGTLGNKGHTGAVDQRESDDLEN